MSDDYEGLGERARRDLLIDINSGPADRDSLERLYGQVWDPQEVARDFEILEFAAPFCVVRRRSDSQLGSLKFRHHPRWYFAFVPADEGEVRAMGKEIP